MLLGLGAVMFRRKRHIND
ncbi:MAG: hypothetical protein FVQ85_05560 [Planctomycetes bacterium]|nr:hypothetical protein [Planctomycetota bacterium]